MQHQHFVPWGPEWGNSWYTSTSGGCTLCSPPPLHPLLHQFRYFHCPRLAAVWSARWWPLLCFAISHFCWPISKVTRELPKNNENCILLFSLCINWAFALLIYLTKHMCKQVLQMVTSAYVSFLISAYANAVIFWLQGEHFSPYLTVPYS